jgi:hypothetical protein
LSHLKERKATNCLNCNAEVQGKYCSVCGQENIEPYESVWHLITHFFQDITHFDGKFFSSLNYLIFKPGFLSREYLLGRRASYLNPVRMYVFTSAIFFLIFFSFFVPKQDAIEITISGKTAKEFAKMDSLSFKKFTSELNNGKAMNREEFNHYKDSILNSRGLHFGSDRYRSRAQYDSLISSGKKKHNWLKKRLIHKEIELNEKYKNNQNQILQSFIYKLFHSFPQMLFISLPIFALLLKMIYSRHKNLYYVNHAIFSIHLYVFIFVMLFFILTLDELSYIWHAAWLEYFSILIVAAIFFYEYKAMRVFYAQSRAKTFLKFSILNVIHFFVMILLFIFFMLFSFLKV